MADYLWIKGSLNLPNHLIPFFHPQTLPGPTTGFGAFDSIGRKCLSSFDEVNNHLFFDQLYGF